MSNERKENTFEGYGLEDDAGVQVESSVTELRQHWVNEKCAPELLFYQAGLVDEVRKQIKSQQDLLDSNREKQGEVNTDDFVANLYQLEIDRIQYIISSYLRTRLQKIEKNAMHILMHRDITVRLSPSERKFVEGYLDLVEAHFQSSFLDQIPPKFRSLTKKDDHINMVVEPNLNDNVFLKAKRTIEQLDISDDGSGAPIITLNDGDILAASYRAFKGLLMEGEIDLL